MIKNSLASVICESVCDAAFFLPSKIRLYELGCDAASFFSRIDDRLKLEEKKNWLSKFEGLRTEKCALQGRREVNI
jgi:hypothetical protein